MTTTEEINKEIAIERGQEVAREMQDREDEHGM